MMATRDADVQAYNDAQQVAHDYICAVCKGRLTVPLATDGNWQAVCGTDSSHTGYVYPETAMEVAQRGEGPVYMVNQAQRASAIMRKENMNAVVGEVAHKFDLTQPQATVFCFHAMRVQLDPFFAQIIPLVFKSKKHEGKMTVVPFVTEKGWAALAARAEPHEFMGPPGVRPVLGEEKESLGYDAGDIVYAVSGQKKSWPSRGSEIYVAYTKKEQTGATGPARDDPHHMARMRALRRWYEENFPDARAVIVGAQEEAPEEMVETIEGEYSIIEDGAPAAQPRRQNSRPQGGGRDGNITQAQTNKVLGMAHRLFDWNKEELERQKLGGRPLSQLTKSEASQLIDWLQSEEDSISPPQNDMFGGGR